MKKTKWPDELKRFGGPGDDEDDDIETAGADSGESSESAEGV